MERYNDLGRN